MGPFNHNFPFSEPDRPRSKTIYMSGVCSLFDIANVPCGRLRVCWSHIVLMAHVSTGGKAGD